jgi:CubicO group peptidase (beta-lactamase class C family)
MDQQSLRGVSVSLVRDQQVVYSKGFGFADFENQRPATEETRYRVASITKLFTSIALMQLIENEKLSLNTAVVDIIPELKNIQNNDYRVDEMTIKSILTHTTGLPTHPYFLLDKRASNRNLGVEDFLQKLPEQSLLFPPNRMHKYSNLGMNLGGVIVQRITGKPYSEYVRDAILVPLQMNSSGFPQDLGDSSVIGYSRLANNQRVRDEFPEMASLLGLPSAGLISNATDLAKFLSWHFNTLGGEDGSILSTRTLAEMQRVQWLPLPLALHPSFNSVLAFIANSLELGGTGFGYFREKEFVVHGGGLMGFASEFMMNNKNRIGLTVLANSLDTPVRLNHPQSISRNLYEMVGLVAAATNSASDNLNYVEYENVYSDGHNWFYYVTEVDDNLVLLNLLDSSPLANPIVLSKVAKDQFVDPNHKGFYFGEFFVEFHRDQSGLVEAMIVNTEKLYARR